MMAEGRTPAFSFKDAFLREWWVVALVVVAALIVGGAYTMLRGGAGTQYRAQSVMAVDQSLLTRNPGVARADVVLKALRGTAFQQRVAQASGLTPEQVATGLVVFSQGNPTGQIFFTYDAKSKTKAEAVAKAAAEQGVKIANELSRGPITRQQDLIATTDGAIKQMEQAQTTTKDPWQLADLQYKTYNAKASLITAKDDLAQIMAIYTFDGSVGVNPVSKVSASASVLGAALIAGLVLGFALAVGRELLLRRRAA